MAGEPSRRIETALTRAIEAGTRLGFGRPTALGWATVELDRAAREVAVSLGLTADAFVTGSESVALGAHCRIAPDALGGGVALALIEPSTEGLLAATLARYDEGPAAVWFTASDDPVAIEAAPVVSGPFGPERLVRGGSSAEGLWLLVAAWAGTIDA